MKAEDFAVLAVGDFGELKSRGSASEAIAALEKA